MKRWLVRFNPSGSILSVELLDANEGTDCVVVDAPDEASARRVALSIYCRRKKAIAKARLHAEGRCGCGRKRDRIRPNSGGKLMFTCSVCAERAKGWKDASAVRAANAKLGIASGPRDEQSRVAANLGRQRDRRPEIRIETLIEVRQAWLDAKTIAKFGQWLQSEIDACLAKKTG